MAVAVTSVFRNVTERPRAGTATGSQRWSRERDTHPDPGEVGLPPKAPPPAARTRRRSQ